MPSRHSKTPTKGDMIWGGIVGDKKLPLTFIEGTLDPIGYLKILRERVAPFVEADSDRESIVFQQDNAPCHKAGRCIRWFGPREIRVMEWPANSADLNPIENMWHIIKQRLVTRTDIHTRAQQVQAIEEVWESIGPETLLSLVDSMPRRVQAVLKAGGGPINY